MKLTLCTLGGLAVLASAAAPYRFHFPRNNMTASSPAKDRPPQLKPSLPLGTQGSARSSAHPQAPESTDPVIGQEPTSNPGGDEKTGLVTATQTSTIHMTVTHYVHASPSARQSKAAKIATPLDEESSLLTTTVTSRTTTTVVLHKAAAAHTAAVGSGPDQRGSQCAPVTVTEAPAIQTVYVTVTPQASDAGGRPTTGRKFPSGKACGHGAGKGCVRPTTTLQSLMTVVPYPSSNGTHSSGTARPSGATGLHH